MDSERSGGNGGGDSFGWDNFPHNIPLMLGHSHKERTALQLLDVPESMGAVGVGPEPADPSCPPAELELELAAVAVGTEKQSYHG
jgi:hypothetical protein